MRPNEIFRDMSVERALHFCRGLNEGAPHAFSQALALAGAAMRARPVFLKKQPFPRRAEAVRRALARVASNDLAEEMLAIYFLDCRKELLTDWLDRLGVEHEDGVLKADRVEQPEEAVLREKVESFRGVGGDDERGDRELLLLAFAAQSSIDWPVLDALLAA